MIFRRIRELREDHDLTQAALADYLGVDRSALSSTLSQMQRDGLLVLGRRTVELRTPPETL